MISSMTGFSSATLAIPQKGSEIHLTMTLKSLNSRFFELNCKVPFSLTQLETDLIRYFKSKLLRGNVYFTIHMSTALTSSIEPSINIISNYLKSIEKIKSTFSLAGELTIHDLISLPNVFETQENLIEPVTMDLIMKAIEALTDRLSQARQAEGKILAQDLANRITTIKDYMSKLEPRAKNLTTKRKEDLFKTLKELVPGTQESALEGQSLAIYNQLEKIDVHEEIVRFKAHLDNFQNELKSPGDEKGKKIDFTLQELFREINTLTSKAADAEISSLAINIKVELEKAREQAQNIV